MLHRGASKIVLALAIGVLLAPLTWGKSIVSAKGKKATETVEFTRPTKINGTVLAPAQYRIVADGNELEVRNLDDKVIAGSFITWEQLDHETKKTKMDIDRGVLTKVELGGTHDAVLLHRWSPGASAKHD